MIRGCFGCFLVETTNSTNNTNEDKHEIAKDKGLCFLRFTIQIVWLVLPDHPVSMVFLLRFVLLV
jgi:hypothetical protein